MKNSRQTPISSPAEDVEKNTSDSADHDYSQKQSEN